MNLLSCLFISTHLLNTGYTPATPKPITDSIHTTVNKIKTTAEGTYELKWADEFDGNTINKDNWTFETGNGRNGWGNNEKEYYQPDNAIVKDGQLIITARKQSMGGFPYTSSRMITKGKQEFTYGRIEARMKLPQGQGQWPAFWMLGANIDAVSWPKCGEIDIMENTNTSDTILGTLHWFNTAYTYSGGKTTSTPTAYHVYSIDWTPKAITWFIDGVQFHTVNITDELNGTDEFHKPFFLLLNLAIGGNLPGQQVDEDKLPASMYVDYVRVYQLKK